MVKKEVYEWIVRMHGLEKKEVMRGTFSRLTSEDSISLKLQVTDGEIMHASWRGEIFFRYFIIFSSTARIFETSEIFQSIFKRIVE
jgi:hypothetical protein